MKKVIALVISLVLLGSGAMAEIPDVSSLTDEELATLQETIAYELSERGFEKTAILRPGTYVGGEDIPVGKYVLETDDTQKSGKIMLVSPGSEDEDEIYKVYEYLSEDEEASYYVNVEEGDYLMIERPFKLTITTGIKFE